MIVAAAIKINGLIMTMPQPARHSDILRQWIALQNEVLLTANCVDACVYIEEIQGFIDDKGVFYDRKAAMDHCNKVDQPLTRRNALLAEGKNIYQGDELYSEDLW